MSVTEFDEQAGNKQQALRNVARIYALYIVGRETNGVLSGYQSTALGCGATWTEIEETQRKVMSRLKARRLCRDRLKTL
jgi:hypothetical protein